MCKDVLLACVSVNHVCIVLTEAQKKTSDSQTRIITKPSIKPHKLYFLSFVCVCVCVCVYTNE